MGELSDFSVRAIQDLGSASKLPNSSPHTSATVSPDSEYSLYLFGLPMQAQGDGYLVFHNGQTEAIKEKLTLTASLSAHESPIPGWPAGEWVWQLRGKHLLHPDTFYSDQPVISQLTETVEILESALAGRIDATLFRSRLDRIGLPIEWRNHLALEVFRQLEAPKPVISAPAYDPLASLLDQVAVAGETPQGNAAQAFIAQVGSDTHGFSLDKPSATSLLNAFKAFRKQMQVHAEQAGLSQLFGWGAALAALTKGVRGRARQLAWLVSPWAETTSLVPALRAHQGPVEVLALAGFSNWESIWTPGYTQLAEAAKTILVQVPEGEYIQFKLAAKASPWSQKIFLMGGSVMCAFGDEASALKPAALAYVEACLAQKLSPYSALEDALILEDQDPSPGRKERHVAQILLSETEWIDRCRRGENILNGKLGSASILFRPLVSAEVSV